MLPPLHLYSNFVALNSSLLAGLVPTDLQVAAGHCCSQEEPQPPLARPSLSRLQFHSGRSSLGRSSARRRASTVATDTTGTGEAAREEKQAAWGR